MREGRRVEASCLSMIGEKGHTNRYQKDQSRGKTSRLPDTLAVKKIEFPKKGK